MANTSNDLKHALSIVHSSDLKYPDDQLLECFLQDSIDPGAAAHYMLQRCSAGRDTLDLGQFLADWKQLVISFTDEMSPHPRPERDIVADVKKRDGGKCCITGLQSSLFDPLIVAPILPARTVEKSLHDILGVFVGSEMQQRLLASDALLNGHRNHWLVRKSAAVALSRGYFQFRFTKGSDYRVAKVPIGVSTWPSIVDKMSMLRPGRLVDHSASGIDIPDVSLLRVVSRFAKPMRWASIGREIASRQPPPASSMPASSFWHLFSEHATVAFINLCRLIPAALRIRLYRFLGFMGAHLYGSTSSLKVQRLPFGMYLKTTSSEDSAALVNEYGALQLVRRRTHVPVPRPLDLVSSGSASYLLTSRLPGHRLGMCIDSLSEGEVNTLVGDLRTCLIDLRAIPKQVAPNYAISNTLGGPCYDFRLITGLEYDKERGDFIGPFADEGAFNKALQIGALPGVSHSTGHEIVFTHGDLNMRNVLVHDGRLSGIVDWENSGWFPDYWEYTKAHFVTKLQKRWLRIVDDVFTHFSDFKSELATERQFWEYCC
ncbi:hypothetical protein F66182_3779 [Fusarium sp. NRRL 66182]|nr:hypothetical protein F66182_3779 [Fusarium sp. NRRL 66182]